MALSVFVKSFLNKLRNSFKKKKKGFESRGVPAFLETTGVDGAVKCLKWILDPNSKG